MTRDTHRGALAALDRILNRGGDADDVLRAIVDVLGPLYPYVAIEFVEEGGTVTGPARGESAEPSDRLPIVYEGLRVADLVVAGAGEGDRVFLERVATVISPYCLVGWDTGGEAWAP